MAPNRKRHWNEETLSRILPTTPWIPFRSWWIQWAPSFTVDERGWFVNIRDDRPNNVLATFSLMTRYCTVFCRVRIMPSPLTPSKRGFKSNILFAQTSAVRRPSGVLHLLDSRNVIVLERLLFRITPATKICSRNNQKVLLEDFSAFYACRPHSMRRGLYVAPRHSLTLNTRTQCDETGRDRS